MQFGIVTGPILNIRTYPDHRAEMRNQILFGEIFNITEYLGKWIKIETFPDNFQGWIAKDSLFRILSEKNRLQLEDGNIHILRHLRKIKPTSPEYGFWIFPGSTLFQFNPRTQKFTLGTERLTLEKPCPENSDKNIRTQISETALSFLNAPHLWGGCSLFGIDSSGLIQVVFKINGVSLPRPVIRQAVSGQPVNFLEEAQTGDLAFFDNAYGDIDHVGILTGQGTIVHVSGKVKIDPIDNQGIPGPIAGSYSHKLRIIKSFL